MGLIHANLCSSCETRRTKHPSGICCRCRRLALRTPCIICGSKAKTGQLCYECRKRLEVHKNLDVAISEQQQRLSILKLRKEGMTFREISEAVGLPNSSVYTAYKNMMQFPVDIAPDVIDLLDLQKSEAE